MNNEKIKAKAELEVCKSINEAMLIAYSLVLFDVCDEKEVGDFLTKSIGYYSRKFRDISKRDFLKEVYGALNK